MADCPPVVMIGLDATEITIIDSMIDEGKLPHLQRMRENGCFGRIQNQPEGFLSMVWPSFSSSTHVTQHGWYFNKMWRHERQRIEYADRSWLSNEPFWNHLSPDRYRIALLDVPFTIEKPTGLNGLYLNGWQNHDDFGRSCVPRALWGQFRSRFGAPAMGSEIFGQQSVRTLKHIRRECLESVEQFSQICAHLLREDKLDLLVAIFGGPHRATHYLWDVSQIDIGTDRHDDDVGLLERVVVDIYQSWDVALGRLLDAAGPDARVIAFALHGMHRHTGWVEYFGDMVARIQSNGEVAPQKAGLVYRVKRALPWKLVRQVTTRVPHSFNKAVVPIWSSRMCHWPTTKYFAVPMDLSGYLRFNLLGREPMGIVEPGAEYDELCDYLKQAFLSFEDIESGKPIVSQVKRIDEIVNEDVPARDRLPDMIVFWADDAFADDSSGVRSDQFGEVRWPRGCKRPSGRSGNHLRYGWFCATGPGIKPGPCQQPHDTVDLAPTAMHWLGADIPKHFHGQPIARLCGDREPGIDERVPSSESTSPQSAG